MCDLTESGKDQLTARFRFPEEFVGFQGHFAGRPVLPAVCNIQAAVAMLEAWKGRSARLSEIIVAKFSSPVTSDEEVLFSCSMKMEDDDRAVVNTTVSKEGDSIARFKLSVMFERGEPR
jgi:3-hydroxymyristoyl/3-hydroxydecanoyl-(acyl carrier protein) dehydratase